MFHLLPDSSNPETTVNFVSYESLLYNTNEINLDRFCLHKIIIFYFLTYNIVQ